jgi:hypothetical protein
MCSLTSMKMSPRFLKSHESSRSLQPLLDLLDGVRRTSDLQNLWPAILARTPSILRKGRHQIDASIRSPDGTRLAACVEVKTLLGLKTQHAGLIYAITQDEIVGRVSIGRRDRSRWARDE